MNKWKAQIWSNVTIGDYTKSASRVFDSKEEAEEWLRGLKCADFGGFPVSLVSPVFSFGENSLE